MWCDTIKSSTLKNTLLGFHAMWYKERKEDRYVKSFTISYGLKIIRNLF